MTARIASCLLAGIAVAASLLAQTAAHKKLLVIGKGTRPRRAC